MSSQGYNRLNRARKQSARSPPEKDWLALKSEITFRYCEMDLDLRVVITQMIEEFQFHATCVGD